ncbi:hypothetical protein [Parvularcula dongshanensis]|uniref:Flagellar basal-body rod protein FlgB n=1 Tax=Parvularcula dongshanensis TaxID=1173995 RepID=A0A840I1S2_9PROT|nr:hypothetical protein [Parvularcula dongshanensis]MBB4658295.1 flagellar basal-body rod protein FlgB [Parvularcula dongshanensis]
MLPNPSLLGLASAMARHAGHVHAVTADNVARADMRGAKAKEAARFGDALRGEPLQAKESRNPISLDSQLVRMAQNAGRHDAAITVWTKTLDLMRLAAGSPR